MILRFFVCLSLVAVLVGLLWVAVLFVRAQREWSRVDRALSEEIERVHTATQKIGPCGFCDTQVTAPFGYYHRIQLNYRARTSFLLDDQKLKNLEGLSGIVGLDLSENQITDAGLGSLSGLVDLEYLQISRNPITDRGLYCLSSLRHLEVLDVVGTSLTEEAAKPLERFPRLKVVYAKGTRLTNVKGVRVDTEHDSTTWTQLRPDPLQTITDVRMEDWKAGRLDDLRAHKEKW